MKKFLKDICFYCSIMMTILFLIGYQSFDLSNFKNIISRYPLFTKKADYFETFIKDKNSINLILGSSISRDSIIPDSLGNNWFSFTNSGQNIYNSYKFLEFYQGLVKIDTIIIGIQPFDFPNSYIKNREGNMPNNNDAFHIFGFDSVNNKKNIIYKNIQGYKEYFFPDLINITMNKTIEEKRRRTHHDVWTKQGFSGYINTPMYNLDSLYNYNPKKERRSYLNFYNVKNNPNLKYFDLFNALTTDLNIKVIYLLTPKSKYYHLDLAEYQYDSIWNNVLDSLGKRNVQIWNYEKMNTDTFKINWFWDDTHSSYDGAKAFTKVIKKSLRD